MPGPFEKPAAPDADKVVSALEKGHRAQQILGLGVAADLERRERAVWKQAKDELRDGKLTQERAFMHVACANALARYREELESDITAAQRVANQLHAEQAEDESTDGDQ